MSTTAVSRVAPEKISPEGMRTIIAAHLAFLVDMFDIYLPIICLAPAMEYFMPKSLPVATRTTVFYMTLAATLVGRPIGAMIFGHYGDKLGRKRSALVAMLGFAIVTLLMALLPGYETIGLWSIGLLIFSEVHRWCLPGRRIHRRESVSDGVRAQIQEGLGGRVCHWRIPSCLRRVSIFTIMMLKLAPAGDLHSPYVQWGWRVPFLVGVALAFGIYIYFAKFVPESKLWLEQTKSQAPLKELFHGQSLRNFLQVFLMMSGVWLVFNTLPGTLPGVLITVLKVDAKIVTNSLMLVNFILFFGYLAAGQLGQMIGRKKVLIAVGILSATIIPYMYYLLISGGFKTTSQLLLLALAMELLFLPGTWGVALAYITERFRTSIRASGFGMGYSLSVLIPSFYSFYMLGLRHFMPYKYTQIPLVALGGILLVIGAALGPETKDVDF